MYKIVKSDDGTVTVVRGFNRTTVGVYPTVEAAQAWIEDKMHADEVAELAREKGRQTHCHYCGGPTTRGVCPECGSEI